MFCFSKFHSILTITIISNFISQHKNDISDDGIPFTIDYQLHYHKMKTFGRIESIENKSKNKFTVNDMCTSIGRIKAIFFYDSKTNNQSH